MRPSLFAPGTATGEDRRVRWSFSSF
jgi:hypothetical protein